MADKLTGENRDAVKSEWVEYFQKFFKPIIEGEFDRAFKEKETAFHFFLLEKA